MPMKQAASIQKLDFNSSNMTIFMVSATRHALQTGHSYGKTEGIMNILLISKKGRFIKMSS